MAIETFEWKSSDYLDTPEAIAAYLDAALEDGDPRVIAHALGEVLRSQARFRSQAGGL